MTFAKNLLYYTILRGVRGARWLAPWRMLKRAAGLKPRLAALKECRRILVVRPDEIGDVVMTSPFFRMLRLAAPQARITALTNEMCRGILEHCPHLDEVYACPFKACISGEDHRRIVAWAMKFKLSRLGRGFDLVLLPRADADWYGSELVAHLVAGRGAVVVNSAAYIKWTIDMPRSGKLADIIHEIRRAQSDVVSNLELLRFCGAAADSDSKLEFWSGPQDKLVAGEWLARGEANRPKLVFHPPSGRSLLKRWPVGRSREFLEKIISATEFEVIVVGGEQDRWVLDELAGVDGGRVRMAFDLFTLPQLGEVIRRCGYFLGGDSGPMHIAAAVGASVVGVFGYASETRFRPWSVAAEVVSLRYHCSPDSKGTYEANCMSCIYPENRCLAELTADQVLAEAVRFFREGSRPAAGDAVSANLRP